MKASNNAERIGKVFGWTKEARGKIGWDPKETPGKRGELRKSRWTPEKQGTFKTPEKQEELRKSLVFFRKYQEKEKASKKAGEHRKKKELWYNTKKMWSSPREAGEMEENTGKRWRNTRNTWRAKINRKYIVVERLEEMKQSLSMEGEAFLSLFI